MQRRDGFTLIEIMLAVFILLIVLGLAVPSLNGVLADKRLHRSLDGFNRLVREAHEHSVAERRAYLIAFDDRGIRVQPSTFSDKEERKPLDSLQFGRGEKWAINFPAALSKTTAPAWIFWESGVCEPARVSFAGPDGKWTAEYAPLNALAEITAYAAR